MQKIKIGHLGLGHMHIKGKMECVRRYPDFFEIVGIAEFDNDKYNECSLLKVYEGLIRISS